MSKLGIKLSKVLLAAAFMILATLIATQHLRLSNHTLLNNGNWTSEKVSLAKTVYGAKSFISRRQALAFGHLDLSAWHGYQEVTLLEDRSPEEVRFDFMLSEDAYVVFIWDRNDAGYSGFRFSTHPRFEAIMFRTLIDGEFTEKRPTGIESLVPDQWHRARFVFKSDALDVYLDGEKVFRSPKNTGGNFEVGFKGGLRPALIDNIEIMGVDGTLLRENFSNTSPMLQPAMTALAIVLGLSGAVYLFVRRTANTHQAYLSVVLLNIVLLVVGTTLYVYRYVSGALYPTIDLFMQEEELRWKTREAEIINDRIQQEFGSPQNSPEYRILFIGSSQTWGAGALRPEDTIPNVLERSLNRNSEIPVRCINGGISSLRSAQLLDLFRTQWLKLGVDAVVINLSNNDSNLSEFERNLDEMIQLSLANQIQVVLVLEPNSFERDEAGIVAKHAVVRSLATRYGVVQVDMHDYLKNRYDDGFLWWDSVHLTSFGQRLFAKELERAVEWILAPNSD